MLQNAQWATIILPMSVCLAMLVVVLVLISLLIIVLPVTSVITWKRKKYLKIIGDIIISHFPSLPSLSISASNYARRAILIFQTDASPVTLIVRVALVPL